MLHEQEANRIAGMESGWARYYAHAEDADLALTHLQKAVDKGMRIMDWNLLLPEFKTLSGEPQYEAIRKQHLDAVNLEREKVGWVPLAAVGLSNYQGVIE